MTASAKGAYATLTAAKLRLGDTDSNDDTLLQGFCDQVNQYIETKTGRIFVPEPSVGTMVFTQDGFDALENGRLMLFPRGIVSLAQLRVGTYTGAPKAVIPAGDWFLRPSGPDLQPGWPYTELWMTNIPSAGDTLPYFPPGFDTVELTGVFGWPAMPDDIVTVGLDLVVAAYQARASSGGDSFTIGTEGQRTWNRLLSATDRETLDRYTRRDVDIV